ncbi:MAG TPA: DNA repair protein RadA [Spirochaetia bacterium]|nr:DNA repair protein RadA [Spirochaetia bacterium]
MGKTRTRFVCSVCEHQEPKWLGRCPVCNEWNTFTESVEPVGGQRKAIRAGAAAKAVAHQVVAMGAVETLDQIRWSTGMSELDRVLGGGIVPGSTILVGGEPGIGKSTLMIQAAGLARVPAGRLYLAGEEAPAQLKSRAERVGLAKAPISITTTTELDPVLRLLDEQKPSLLIVDSIQTLHSIEAGDVPGTVNQIKYCALELSQWARETGSALFLVAHITKEGSIAGPKILEHMVDAVLYFDQSEGDVRFLRTTKNRFGPTDEVGIFTMQSGGLTQVVDPSSLFLIRRNGTVPPGVVAAPIYEGSRILLVEIQALTVPAKGGISRVFSDRIDSGRVSRLAAVLEKHLGLRFSDQDIYVNVAGGMKISEVGVDLPLALALYSARTGVPLPAEVTVTGELSLAGEVRPVQALRRRIRAAIDMNYRRCVGPAALREGEQCEDAWVETGTIAEAVKAAFAEVVR